MNKKQNRTITILQLYPNEMNIYGDRGNVLTLLRRIEWHGYTPKLAYHHPGKPFRKDVDLIVGGGGQDSGQGKVQDDLLGFDLCMRTDLPWPAEVPPGALAMYGGLPDIRLVPRVALARAYRRALRRPEVLEYGDPRGHRRLRTALAQMLTVTRGLVITADEGLRGGQKGGEAAERARKLRG
jgi:hypothetical protein